VLALARLLADDEGGQGRVGGHEEGADSRHRHADHDGAGAADGWPRRVQRLLRLEAQARLDEGVVARAVRQRAGGAVARDGGIDEALVEFAQRFVVNAQLLGDAGPEVLDQDVRLLGQAMEGIAGGGLGEIERDAFLAPVPDHLARRVAAGVALRRADFDDLGAVIGERHAHQLTGHRLAEVERPDFF
jgi:hypothetical protein